MKTPTGLLLCLILLFTPLDAHSRDWWKYTTDNFTLYSDSRESKVRNLLENFETFRVIALTQLGLPVEQPENERLIIIMFNRGKDYSRSGAPKTTAGYFNNTVAGPRMVVSPSRRIDSQSVLFHEYVHYLLRQHSTFNYPRWYDEGLAEVLSSAEIQRNSVLVGQPPSYRIETLNFLGKLRISQLLDLKDRDENSGTYEARFYASAWLLTHYLQINGFQHPELGQATRDFLIRYNNGEDPQQAFEAAFGATTTSYDQQLGRYLRGGIPGMKWSKPELDVRVEKLAVPRNEISYLLAKLAWSAGNEEGTREFLEDNDGSGAFFAEIQSLLAVLDNHREEASAIASARTLADSALALAPHSADVLGNLAHYEWDNYLRQAAQNDSRSQASLGRSEAHALRALELGTSDLSVYQFLADIAFANNQLNAGLKYLVQGYTLQPSYLGFPTRIMTTLVKNNRPDLARPYLVELISAAHSTESRQLMLTLLDQIDKGEIDPDLVSQL